MGLAYFFILIMIVGSAGLAVIFLSIAWIMRKKAHLIGLAILLLLGGLFAAAAVYLVVLFLREPPWRFHF